MHLPETKKENGEKQLSRKKMNDDFNWNTTECHLRISVGSFTDQFGTDWFSIFKRMAILPPTS